MPSALPETVALATMVLDVSFAATTHVSAPLLIGANSMVTVQLPAAGIDVLLHPSFISVKEAALAPPTLTARVGEAVLPAFVSVKVFVAPTLPRTTAGGGNAYVAGVNDSVDALSPVPLTVALTLPPGDAATVIVAFCAPSAVG